MNIFVIESKHTLYQFLINILQNLKHFIINLSIIYCILNFEELQIVF